MRLRPLFPAATFCILAIFACNEPENKADANLTRLARRYCDCTRDFIQINQQAAAHADSTALLNENLEKMQQAFLDAKDCLAPMLKSKIKKLTFPNYNKN